MRGSRETPPSRSNKEAPFQGDIFFLKCPVNVLESLGSCPVTPVASDINLQPLSSLPGSLVFPAGLVQSLEQWSGNLNVDTVHCRSVVGQKMLKVHLRQWWWPPSAGWGRYHVCTAAAAVLLPSLSIQSATGSNTLRGWKIVYKLCYCYFCYSHLPYAARLKYASVCLLKHIMQDWLG